MSKSETDRALRVAQEQEQVLRRLEREIARSKDYLQKVTVTRRDGRRDMMTYGSYRQCEVGKKVRPRTGLISKKTCWGVRMAAVGQTRRCIEEN